MKKILFDKAITITKGASHTYTHRANFPAYLLTHSCHPDREFAVARFSKSNIGDFHNWWFLKGWAVFDRATGIPIANTRANTRAEAVDTARGLLSKLTAEEYAARVLKVLVIRAEKILDRDAGGSDD